MYVCMHMYIYMYTHIYDPSWPQGPTTLLDAPTLVPEILWGGKGGTPLVINQKSVEGQDLTRHWTVGPANFPETALL